MKEERKYFVHGVKDVYKDNPMISNWVNVHTHGLEKCGLANISIVAPEDDIRLAEVIYTVGDMMQNGEQFELDRIHSIDSPDGACRFKFILLPTTCFGEDTLRIVLSDPETNEFFADKDGEEGIYCLQKTVIFDKHEIIE